MDTTAIFLYGMVIGLLFGFGFASALNEIRMKRIIRELKKGASEE